MLSLVALLTLTTHFAPVTLTVGERQIVQLGSIDSIVVAPRTYSVVVHEGGAAEFTGVTPGKFPFLAWRPDGRWLTFLVTVEAAGTPASTTPESDAPRAKVVEFVFEDAPILEITRALRDGHYIAVDRHGRPKEYVYRPR